ncbi:MAG TPA: ribbon-helix-helix domain-containing protein [Rhizobiaceae bacterium]|nr:ribbon-helix-helix domain-containing protein [Rhizobiaceae bacterium]
MLNPSADGRTQPLGVVRPDRHPERIVAAEDVRPVFRAINTPKERRGIRLESIYWDVLKSLAKSANHTLGEQVELAVDGSPRAAANLASLLRVVSVKWLMERIARLEAVTAMKTTDAIVQASPSPAFALSADKRILLHNRALLSLIQSRFVGVKPEALQRGLRLSLDTQIEQVVAELTHGAASTMVTGFVLGLEGQRIRGNLNMVLAPVSSQTVIIAYVASL